MLKHLAKAALFIGFVVALILAKETVMVTMAVTRVDEYLPTSWQRYAPYVVLAILVFSIVGWLFTKQFRSRTIALSIAASLLFVAGPLVYLHDPLTSDNLFLISANTALAFSFVVWVIVFARSKQLR